MFFLLLILPVFAFLLFKIYNFKCDGVRACVRNKWFWIELAVGEVFSLLMLCVLFMSFTAFLSFSLIKLFAVAVCSLFFFASVGLIKYIKKSKKLFVVLIFSVLLALFLECTLFNFRVFQTFEYEPVDLSDKYDVVYMHSTGKYENEYKKPATGVTPYLYIDDLDNKINNIYFDIRAYDGKGEAVGAYVTVSVTDESNANLFRLPTQTVMHGVESTKYLNLITNGNSTALKLSVTTDFAEIYRIQCVKINVPQPFQFKILRVLVVALVAFLVYLLRPKSKIWTVAFSGSSKQRMIICAVVLLEIALLIGVSTFNPMFQKNPSSHTAQYQQLAQSFLDGRLYLDKAPPEYLAEMENPYDYGERTEIKEMKGQGYYWDASYFEGKYYVYFGVVPVLLTYLPYRALTNTDMPNVMAIRFFTVFFVIGSFLLIYRLIKRYFKERKIPFVSYLLISLIFVNASCGIFIAKRPDFYSVPIISGLAFTVLGLYFWLLSLKNEGRVNGGFAALGSLCLALVAGCRPQLLVVSAFAFLLFWNSVFKDRSLFSKKSIWQTVAICMPYIIVAAGIMWYNYARFGSPFDFGQNYNLTTNDMTGRGYRVERVGLSLFTYFFQLPNISAAFPFINSVRIDTNYLGTTITEPMFGGIFAVIPLLWCFAILPFIYKGMVKGHRLAFCLLPLGLSLFIGAFDAQGAGLLQRYVNDFSFLAILAAAVVIFYVYEKTRGRLRNYVNAFLGFATVGSGVYCFLIIFAKYSVELYNRNPLLFNYVSEMVQFW